MLHGKSPRRAARHTVSGRSGFTLVELLVVIFIIAILAGLVTFAGWKAIGTMRETAIVVEIGNLEGAITAYKDKLPDRFPDTITQNSGGTPAGTLQQSLVRSHIGLLYQRNREGNIFAADRGDGNPGAFAGVELDPSEAFVYFLGGNPTINPVTNRPIGLFDNAEYPLSGGPPGQPVAQRKSFFTFDTRRLVDLDGDGFFSYVPPYPSNTAPYVYFENRTYSASFVDYTAVSRGVIRPYAVTQTATQVIFEQPTTFQIIAPGMDGHFGDLPTGTPPPFKLYPAGTYYTRQDRDNVASFAKADLESKLP